MTSVVRTSVPIDGLVDDRFSGLRAEFERRLASGEELGASLAVVIDGEPVVDPASTPVIPEGRVAFWGGWNGSLVIADVERRMTFAYVMNRMSPGIIGSPRSDANAAEVYRAIA